MHALPFVPLMPSCTRDFAALPYDVFSREEAHAYVEAHPTSFLAIDRPETAFAADHDMYAPEVYEHARDLLVKACHTGLLTKQQHPSYYLYELTWHEHTQTGIVAATVLSDYVDEHIRKHELTRPDKEQDRVCHIQTTQCQTGPIFLAYRDTQALHDAIAHTKTHTKPLISFCDEYGVEQRIWSVCDTNEVTCYAKALASLDRAYIADGHHRAASAARVCADSGARELADPTNLDDAQLHPGAYLLTVYFPADELTILPYNRLLHLAEKPSLDKLLEQLETAGYTILPSATPVTPTQPCHLGMYADGHWFELVDTNQSMNSPVDDLDVARLQNQILEPLFGVSDPRCDPRLEFVGGDKDAQTLAQRTGTTDIAFTLCPTRIEQLMAVADAGLLMPPKSTWFEPKLRSGLFIRPLEGFASYDA